MKRAACLFIFLVGSFGILAIEKKNAAQSSVMGLQLLHNKCGEIDSLLEQVMTDRAGQVDAVAAAFDKLTEIIHDQHLALVIKSDENVIQEIVDRIDRFLKIVEEKLTILGYKKNIYRTRKIEPLFRSLRDRKIISQAQYMLFCQNVGVSFR